MQIEFEFINKELVFMPEVDHTQAATKLFQFGWNRDSEISEELILIIDEPW